MPNESDSLLSDSDRRPQLTVDTTEQRPAGSVPPTPTTPGGTKIRPTSWTTADREGWEPPRYHGEDSKQEIRRDFIIKVYTVLSIQLLVTFAISAVFMYWEPARVFAISAKGPWPWSPAKWLLMVDIVIMFALIWAMYAYKNDYPWNGILLGIFTVTNSFLIGYVCSRYETNGLGANIFMAWGITLSIFVFLTVFTVVSRMDFEFLGMWLFAGLWCLLVWSTTCLIFGFTLGKLYALIGALLFAGYIIYDTFMIMNRLGCDDWVIACVDLYLDILNMFLFILRLLGDSKD